MLAALDTDPPAETPLQIIEEGPAPMTLLPDPADAPAETLAPLPEDVPEDVPSASDDAPASTQAALDAVRPRRAPWMLLGAGLLVGAAVLGLRSTRPAEAPEEAPVANDSIEAAIEGDPVDGDPVEGDPVDGDPRRWRPRRRRPRRWRPRR